MFKDIVWFDVTVACCSALALKLLQWQRIKDMKIIYIEFFLFFSGYNTKGDGNDIRWIFYALQNTAKIIIIIKNWNILCSKLKNCTAVFP